MRSLSHSEYLSSGCTLDYDEVFNVDDTVWTYATNFAIMAVCLLAAVYIALSTKSFLMPAYFGFSALSFGTAALAHALIHRTDNPAYYPLKLTVIISFLVSSMFLTLYFLKVATRKKVVFWLFLIASVGVMISALVLNSLIVIGVYQSSALLFMSIVTAIQTFGTCLPKPEAINTSKALGITKSLSGLIMIAGMFIQVSLAGTCGAKGLEECFKNCPLPNPAVFNHNALFHIVYLAGVTCLAWAEYRIPSLEDGGAAYHQDGQELKDDEEEQKREKFSDDLNMDEEQ